MYCRNCANEVNDKAVACPKCGVNPHNEKKFCPSCGTETNANQVMCTKCGVSLIGTSSLAPAQDNSKTVAIVAHLTLVGWIVAIVLNSQNKTELGSFYLRQMLGLFIFSFIWIIPILGWIIGLLIFVLWIISFVNSLSGKMVPVPVVGAMFQRWFNGI